MKYSLLLAFVFFISCCDDMHNYKKSEFGYKPNILQDLLDKETIRFINYQDQFLYYSNVGDMKMMKIYQDSLAMSIYTSNILFNAIYK
jgi:hypothetical protein